MIKIDFETINKILNKIILCVLILFILVTLLLGVVILIECDQKYSNKDNITVKDNQITTETSVNINNKIKICIENKSQDYTTDTDNYTETEIKEIVNKDIFEVNHIRKEKLKLNKFWNDRFNEYYDATYIYKYFKDLGYNDYVCSSILGNIMNECGCNSFNLNVNWYSNGFYGICMWYYEYSPNVIGKDLEYQCEYLADTMKDRIESYGFSYDEFLSSNDLDRVTLIFAIGYERCSSESYRIKQLNAEKAYNYFYYKENNNIENLIIS